MHYSIQLFLLLVRGLIFGWREYAHQFWPFCDLLDSLCYVFAFGIKYLDTVEAFYILVRSQVMQNDEFYVCCNWRKPHEQAGLLFLLQGVSAGFLIVRCMRILSTFQTFGEYILIYFSMFTAIFRGLVIFVLRLCAFTFTRMGLTSHDSLSDVPRVSARRHCSR